MDTHEKALAKHFRELLTERARQLAATLSSRAGLEGAAGQVEVNDFKDLAGREALDEVEDARQARAEQELAQVGEALRRIDDGGFGTCLDCGDAIDDRRLLAMPASRYCASCQKAHERAGA